MRHLPGRDGRGGFGHLDGVLSGSARPVVRDERGEAGGDRVGRDDLGGPVSVLGRVLGGEPHVRVVRQDDRLVGPELP